MPSGRKEGKTYYWSVIFSGRKEENWFLKSSGRTEGTCFSNALWKEVLWFLIPSGRNEEKQNNAQLTVFWEYL